MSSLTSKQAMKVWPRLVLTTLLKNGGLNFHYSCTTNALMVLTPKCDKKRYKIISSVCAPADCSGILIIISVSWEGQICLSCLSRIHSMCSPFTCSTVWHCAHFVLKILAPFVASPVGISAILFLYQQ